MVLGHYAAAFIARPHVREAPLWVLLLCANLAEFLWLGLALAGIEATEPASILDATFQNLKVHMTYSHNVVPNLLLGFGVFVVVYAYYRNRTLALWCAGLTVLHVWCDYIVGFQHEWLGRDSLKIGLDSYGHFPHVAILIELVFAVGCVFYYSVAEKRAGRPVPRRKLVFLYTAFIIGVGAWLPTATIPLRTVLGL